MKEDRCREAREAEADRSRLAVGTSAQCHTGKQRAWHRCWGGKRVPSPEGGTGKSSQMSRAGFPRVQTSATLHVDAAESS